jgi:hypothetical protein
MRTALSVLVATLLVTGCIFPSFDGMQGGSPAKADVPTTETNPAETASIGIDGSARDSSSPSSAPSSAPAKGSDVPTDAGAADVAQTSPGAGKIACGTEQCPVGTNSHCCANYFDTQFYCSMPSHTEGWCTGGGGRVLYCDERADCPTGQVCCQKGDVTSCSASCTGGQALP